MAATWFESLPVRSVTNWEELVEAYMGRFFPPALTSERRGADMIIRRCVPKTKQGGIMEKCHASPYGGHFAEDKTA